jgi:SAM-dependent methyltransferase
MKSPRGPLEPIVGRQRDEPDAHAPRVLDPCCGSRMMWFDRENADVIFGDVRSETLTVTDRSKRNKSGTRTLRIEPDTMLDFRDLPYADNTFRLVAFDPPHLVQAGPRSWLAAKYGKLGADWREDLRRGFAECFRVLASDGVLVFKWNETQVPLRDVLPLAPFAPLFGHTSGRKGMTHWMVFMPPNDALSGRGPTE